MGIDSNLEVFTKSNFGHKDLNNGKRLVLNFHTSEIPILIRRLEDLRIEGNHDAYTWIMDIKSYLNNKENESDGKK
jgi:hypothetical protein